MFLSFKKPEKRVAPFGKKNWRTALVVVICQKKKNDRKL